MYRFKYTLGSAAARTITFHLAGVHASTAFDLERVGGEWRARNEATASATSAGVSVVVSGSGACCNTGSGTCGASTAAACGSNVFIAGAACVTGPCPALGSCCAASGACAVVLEAGCAGVWASGGDCSPSPCPGACCTGTHCTLATASSCTRAGGAFQGAGTACGVPGNPTVCCEANHDGVNGLTVSDVFDFLGDWFVGRPSADFDHSGALGVADIFGFLAGWFAGCE